jgi:hypothetical protein
MLHIQGDLQLVFDALYELGVIEPVLELDWRTRLIEIEEGSPALTKAVNTVNECGPDRTLLMEELRRLDRQSLEVLAMEVAREYADFQTRDELH